MRTRLCCPPESVLRQEAHCLPSSRFGTATVRAGAQVGCGAGNTVFPLLGLHPGIRVYACDFSPTAVELVKAHPEYAGGRVAAFVADATAAPLAAEAGGPVPAPGVDICTLIFVLSAIHPDKMPQASPRGPAADVFTSVLALRDGFIVVEGECWGTALARFHVLCRVPGKNQTGGGQRRCSAAARRACAGAGLRGRRPGAAAHGCRRAAPAPWGQLLRAPGAGTTRSCGVCVRTCVRACTCTCACVCVFV